MRVVKEGLPSLLQAASEQMDSILKTWLQKEHFPGVARVVADLPFVLSMTQALGGTLWLNLQGDDESLRIFARYICE